MTLETEDDLGRVPPDGGAARTTLDNWMQPPDNRWAYQHLRELIPTALISRGHGESWSLPCERESGRAVEAVPLDLPAVGEHRAPDTVGELVGRSHTDAFVVMHRGAIVYERYAGGMGPDTKHLAMSVSKSITATAVGAVMHAGYLSPDDLVCDIVPELGRGGLEGATVRHVLDMRTGTLEEITTLEQQRAYFSICGWAPAREWPPVEDSRSHFRRFRKYRPHGGEFEYRSTLTCVLGLLAERAAGMSLAELVSFYLWQRIGAEQDAEISVDPNRNPLADIGICCTARDLARLGELLRRGGSRPDVASVVPPTWVADILTPEPGQVDAFRTHGSAFLLEPDAYYRNQWWVVRPRTSEHGGVYLALGINGQLLLVHEDAEVVVAKFSSWPMAWHDDLARWTIRGCIDLAESLAASG
ncbi:MAG: serine hydrolase domain-containing protein [Nocardioidaceae bacterium]